MENDYFPAISKLMKLTTRMFYGPEQAVLVDMLLENTILNDSEFCARLKLLPREFNRIIVPLKEDHLVKQELKLETQETGKPILKSMYYLDFNEIREIIKYKLYKMRQLCEKKNKEYEDTLYCVKCEKKFDMLDAQPYVKKNLFKCPKCDDDLVEYQPGMVDNNISVKDLIVDTKSLVDILKELDQMKIPSLDYFQIVEMKNKKQHNIKSLKKESAEPKEIEENEFETAGNEETGIDDFEMAIDMSSADVETKKEILVSVNGKTKSFFNVTEEDKEKMNEDEYTKYFEIYEKHGEDN